MEDCSKRNFINSENRLVIYRCVVFKVDVGKRYGASLLEIKKICGSRGRYFTYKCPENLCEILVFQRMKNVFEHIG